jgi:hypothetical protein
MRGSVSCMVVHPVGFGFIQQLQLVADLSQQVLPPRNVGVGLDTQRSLLMRDKFGKMIKPPKITHDKIKAAIWDLSYVDRISLLGIAPGNVEIGGAALLALSR